MNLLVIAKRELGAYFASPVAYIVSATFLFITGLIFFGTLIFIEQATMWNVFNVIGVVMLFVAPVLTMRLLAEEARMGTLELLMTSPVRDWEVVLGKFVAAFTFYLAMLLPTVAYVFLLIWMGRPNIPVILSGYLGVVLMGAMFLSFGVLTSAMSANQIVAAVLGVGLTLGSWLAGILGYAFGDMGSSLFDYLSVQQHYADCLLGLVNSSSIVYFLSGTIGALFLATRVVELRRWY